MRLTAEQVQHIKNNVHRIYGETAQVLLFGSRVDDLAKGGDIDLLIEIEDPDKASISNQLKLNGALQVALGPQKIDIINYTKGQPANAIQQQALLTGIRL